MSDEDLDLFGGFWNETPRPDTPEPPAPKPFDPANHPCVVCGATYAPFGEGWPHAPKFYCREHRPT